MKDPGLTAEQLSYAVGEMKHGPLALIDESMAIVMVAPQDDLYEKTVSNLEETRARGGQVISICEMASSRGTASSSAG